MASYMVIPFLLFLYFSLSSGQLLVIRIGILVLPSSSKSLNQLDEATLRVAIQRLNMLAERTAFPKLRPLVHRLFPPVNSASVLTAVCKMLRDGAVVFLEPLGGDASTHRWLNPAIERLASRLQLPFLFWRSARRQSSHHPSTSLFLHPSEGTLVTALVDIIDYFQWRRVVLVYDQYPSLHHLDLMLRYRSKPNTQKPLFFHVRRYQRGRGLYKMLEELRLRNFNSVIVDLDFESTRKFLTGALNSGMISRTYHYILTDLDFSDVTRAEFLENFRHNFVNITALSPIVNWTRKDVEESERTPNAEDIYSSSAARRVYTDIIFRENPDIKRHLDIKSLPYRLFILVDALRILRLAVSQMGRLPKPPWVAPSWTNASTRFSSCWDVAAVAENRLRKSQANSFFDSGLGTYAMTPFSHGLTLINYLNAIHDREGLSGEILFHRRQRQNLYLDIFHMRTSGLQNIGRWSTQKSVWVPKSPYDIRQIFPLKNHTVRVVTVIQPPFVIEKPDHEGILKGRDRYEGFCIEMMEHIANRSKFEWELYVEPNNTYGVSIDNKWNGMVREVLEGRADLALGAFSINWSRERAIDFTKPFMSLGISIMFKKPKGERPGLFSFLSPLAVEIWLYVVAAFLVVTLLIYTLARFSPYEWSNPHPCDRHAEYLQNNFTLANSFWFSIGTLMQQGSDVGPRALSTRLVGGIWWFFTLIIISSYTANLAAFLTIERKESPIQNAEDLADQTKIAYGALSNGSTISFFRHSSIEKYKKMWDYMNTTRPSALTDDIATGIDRVKRGNYAFLMESVMIEYYVERDVNCELIQVGGIIDSKGYGIGVSPKHTDLRDQITLRILELQRDQILQSLKSKWWQENGPCRGKHQREGLKPTSLDMHNVGGVFLVLACGLTLGLMVAVAEFVWNSRRNAAIDRQTLCQEMAEELSFALNCYGSSRKIRTESNKGSGCPSCRAEQAAQNHDQRSMSTNSRNRTPERKGFNDRQRSMPSMLVQQYAFAPVSPLMWRKVGQPYGDDIERQSFRSLPRDRTM